MKPVNNHLLIEPVKHESFLSSSRETFEEIGIVIDFDPTLKTDYPNACKDLEKGVRVFFDSWMASKFPSQTDGGFFWVVNWKDVRGIDNE